jgi:hypothetical protein
MTRLVLASLLLATSAHAQPGATELPPGAEETPPDLEIGHDVLRVGPWTAYTGDDGRALSAMEFYDRVGRPDLADEYQHRRHMTITFAVVGVASLVPTLWFGWKAAHPSGAGEGCSSTATIYSVSALPCVPAGPPPDHASEIGAAAFAATSVISLGVAVWYARHIQPVSEAEARDLVDAHNRQLAVAPYATAGGGGFAVSRAF